MTEPRFPDYDTLNEPQLLFHPVDASQRSRHPLRGLLDHGPYSGTIPSAVRNPIRLAAIGPAGEGGNALHLVRELQSRLKPTERSKYLPEWPGFGTVFGTDLTFAPREINVQLPRTLDADLAASAAPHRILVATLADAVRQVQLVRSEFDVLLIYLPLRWEPAFRNRAEDFDLHHVVKGITASLAIPSQIVLEDTATTKPHRCSVAWTISIALYAKAGGVPWKLKAPAPRTAFVGISYATRGEASGGRYVTCCSQVFDAEGAGLEFVAYEAPADQVMMRGRNPFLDHDQMRAVMARSLALYLERHHGDPPRRAVVHKTTRFQPAEIDGCLDALARVDDVELIQVIEDVPWRAIQMRHRGSKPEPTPYPCERGTLLHLGGYEALLWTQGNAPDVAYHGSFFKEGVGIPRPLLLRRWAGRGPAEPAAAEILALTKMNWNNDALYDTVPTTLRYAHTLAQVIKTMPTLQPKPYDYRLFI